MKALADDQPDRARVRGEAVRTRNLGPKVGDRNRLRS